MTSRRDLLRGAAAAAAGAVAAGLAAPRGAAAQTPAADGDVELLTELLRLEHAAVHGYGRLGPLLAEPLQDLARLHADVHRLQRDALHDALVERGAEAPPPELAYALPVVVRDPTTAREAAEALERRSLAGYHAALPDFVDHKARALCAELMAQAAVNLAELGRRRTPPAPLPAFPGRP
jgi:hypothetical protein